MNANLLSRNLLPTLPYVFRKYRPVLPEKAGQEPVYQFVVFNIKATIGMAYLCGKVLTSAAANSLSHYYLPTTVAHDNNCGCL